MGQYVNNGDGALLSCEKVVSATGNTLTIRINGTDFRFTLTDSTPITEKGKKISIGDIKAGDVVTVTSKIGGRVATGISKHPMMSHVMTSVSSGSDADQKSTDYFLQQRQVFEKTRENNNNK